MFGPILLIAICALVGMGAVSYYSMRLAGAMVEPSHPRRLLFVGLFTFFGTLFSTFLFHSMYLVPSDKLGIVTKHHGSEYLKPHEMIANNGQGGVQAVVAAPGWHFYPWPLYTFEIEDESEVPQGAVGIVEALDGKIAIATERDAVKSNNDTPSVLLSPHTWVSQSDWFVPSVFLANKDGYRGLQNPPLSPGKYRLHPKLFRLINVDTTVKQIAFADIESGAPPDKHFQPSMETTLDGVTVWLHARVTYHIVPRFAHMTLEKFGTTTVDTKVEEAVISQIRVTVRQHLRNIGLGDFDQNTEDFSKEVKVALNESLGQYGISILDFGFTSIYDKESGTLDQLREQRALRQKLNEEISTEDVRVKNIKAKAESTALQDDADRKHLVAVANAQKEAMSADSGYGILEAKLLKDIIGEENATKLLVTRQLSKFQVPVVPGVVVGSENVDWDMMRWMQSEKNPKEKSE